MRKSRAEPGEWGDRPPQPRRDTGRGDTTATRRPWRATRWGAAPGGRRDYALLDDETLVRLLVQQDVHALEALYNR